jgi:hypothetical protein
MKITISDKTKLEEINNLDADSGAAHVTGKMEIASKSLASYAGLTPDEIKAKLEQEVRDYRLFGL